MSYRFNSVCARCSKPEIRSQKLEVRRHSNYGFWLSKPAAVAFANQTGMSKALLYVFSYRESG
jgi:hypothetical protein